MPVLQTLDNQKLSLVTIEQKQLESKFFKEINQFLYGDQLQVGKSKNLSSESALFLLYLHHKKNEEILYFETLIEIIQKDYKFITRDDFDENGLKMQKTRVQYLKNHKLLKPLKQVNNLVNDIKNEKITFGPHLIQRM